jgi:hypothetical protein
MLRKAFVGMIVSMATFGIGCSMGVDDGDATSAALREEAEGRTGGEGAARPASDCQKDEGRDPVRGRDDEGAERRDPERGGEEEIERRDPERGGEEFERRDPERGGEHRTPEGHEPESEERGLRTPEGHEPESEERGLRTPEGHEPESEERGLRTPEGHDREEIGEEPVREGRERIRARGAKRRAAESGLVTGPREEEREHAPRRPE